MPQIKFSTTAIQDLQRIQEFLRTKSPAAARRAADAIQREIRILTHHPHLGKPVENMPDPYREWLIDFGHSGYVARYRVEPDAIVILTLRHQKEVGL